MEHILNAELLVTINNEENNPLYMYRPSINEKSNI